MEERGKQLRLVSGSILAKQKKEAKRNKKTTTSPIFILVSVYFFLEQTKRGKQNIVTHRMGKKTRCASGRTHIYRQDKKNRCLGHQLKRKRTENKTNMQVKNKCFTHRARLFPFFVHRSLLAVVDKQSRYITQRAKNVPFR